MKQIVQAASKREKLIPGCVYLLNLFLVPTPYVWLLKLSNAKLQKVTYQLLKRLKREVRANNGSKEN